MKLKYPKLLVLCMTLAVALPLAAVQTRSLGESHIDIGVDLSDEPAHPPYVQFRDGAKLTTLTQMRKISDRYTPRHSFFTLTATGEKTTDSKGSEVWLLSFPFINEVVQNPPGSWVQHGTSLVSSGPQPASLRWEGYTRPLNIRLWCHPYSGVATVQTEAGEQTLDLYASEGKIQPDDRSSYLNDKTVKLDPVEKMIRYQANFPRKALAGLSVDFGHLDVTTHVVKVIIGSLMPRVFIAPGIKSSMDWGIITKSFDPRQDTGRLDFDSISPIEQGGALTFLALFVADLLLIIAGVSLAVAGIKICRWICLQPPPDRALKPFSPWIFLLFFLPFLIVWLVFLGAFFPAIMSPDSIGLWIQAHKGEVYSDLHPAMLTLGIRLITRFWDSPAAVALVQLLSLALFQAYGFMLLYRSGVSLWVIVPCMLTVCLSPKNANMSVTLWKDVLCASNVLLVTVLLARYFVDRSVHRKISYWLLLGLALGFLPFSRHNALPIMLLVGVGLIIFCWPVRQHAWVATAAALSLFLFVRHVLYPYYGVVPTNYARDFAPLKMTADISNLVYHGVPLAQEEYDFLNQIRPFGDRWAYDPIAGGGTIFSPPPFAFNLETAYAKLDDYRIVYRSLIHRYPLLHLRHRLINANYLYDPVESGPNDIECGYQEIVENLCDLSMKPLFPKLHDSLVEVLRGSMEKLWIWLLWRPAIPLYFILLACGGLIWKTRDWRYLIVYLPVLLNTASLVAAISQCQRYQFPTTFAAAFLVCFAFLPKGQKKKAE